jgi:hypothetical protein
MGLDIKIFRMDRLGITQAPMSAQRFTAVVVSAMQEKILDFARIFLHYYM